MKLIYSHLQKFLPTLNVKPQKLRDDLTMIGHFCNFYQENEAEIVFDLDIKVNRGDCLGYYGLAKDLAIYYNLSLAPTPQMSFPRSDYALPIKIESPNVSRVMSIKIVHLQNGPSPEWLQTFLKCHGVNSINTLVDLTNYIMFLYGVPNHAFDTAKSTDNLVWQENPKYSEFTSLDGNVLKLTPNILMINNPQRALSLSFWGGQACAIDQSTTNTIVEVAVYNPTHVRQNSRTLKASTEAAIRLEKQLDPELIPVAFTHLVQLILENCGGQVGSQVFDYYPNPVEKPTIKFNPKLPSIMSGIDIPESFALDIVQKVGYRPDLNLEEDLVEEVVRFYGYQHIPVDQPLKFKEVIDITPKEIYQIEQLKDKMVSEGYDEVLAWPLVSCPLDPKTVITVQNSINSESIYLRQSLIPSLKAQLDQYQRFKLPNPKFFEIGKIFSQANGQYIEKYALGTYDGQNFSETILDTLPQPEIYVPKTIHNQAIELTSQIITLDANIVSADSPDNLIKYYSSKIDSKILWQIIITDHYQDKYTLRVFYYNCDDKIAKKTHLSVFKLD